MISSREVIVAACPDGSIERKTQRTNAKGIVMTGRTGTCLYAGARTFAGPIDECRIGRVGTTVSERRSQCDGDGGDGDGDGDGDGICAIDRPIEKRERTPTESVTACGRETRSEGAAMVGVDEKVTDAYGTVSRGVHVAVCGPAGKRRSDFVDALAQAASDRGDAVVRADADTWSQTLTRATNFCGTKLTPPRDGRGKVCVVNDVDVYVACDRGCVADLRKLLVTFAKSRASIVFACEQSVCAKVPAKKHNVSVVRLEAAAPSANVRAAARVLATDLRELGVDSVCEIVDAHGGSNFVDTLFHNSPGLHDPRDDALREHLRVAVPFATLGAGYGVACTVDANARKCVNAYRGAVACGWWCGMIGAAVPASAARGCTYTNALSQCNARTVTRRRTASAALADRITLAEVVWARIV